MRRSYGPTSPNGLPPSTSERCESSTRSNAAEAMDDRNASRMKQRCSMREILSEPARSGKSVGSRTPNESLKGLAYYPWEIRCEIFLSRPGRKRENEHHCAITEPRTILIAGHYRQRQKG